MMKSNIMRESYKTIFDIWQAKVAIAKKYPYFTSYLLRYGYQYWQRWQKLLQAMRPTKQLVASTITGAALVVGVHITPALANTITVDTGVVIQADDGQCSLIEAITNANHNSQLYSSVGECGAGNGDDTIVLNGGTYHLTTLNNTGELGFEKNGLPLITSTITIEGNNATIQRTGGPDFGILRVTTVGNLTLNDTTIQGAQGERGVVNSGQLTLNRSTISGNTGGVLNDIYATASIINSEISGNTTTKLGGGIHNNYEASLVVSNTVIANNRSYDRGGGIANDGNIITFDKVTIISNTASTRGGGIVHTTVSNTDLQITNSTIANNKAQNGGGIWSILKILTVDNTVISNNQATEKGGGIEIRYGDLTIKGNSVISGNSAKMGGGIYTYANPNITMDSAIVSNNYASGSGGGVFNGRSGTSTITNSIISGNRVTGNGGGIYNIDGDITIQNSHITGNKSYIQNGSKGYGGAIYSKGDWNQVTITLNNSVISNNYAYYYGGGIVNENTTLGIYHSTISNNVGNISGGGIDTWNNGTTKITESTISGNEAMVGGGIRNRGTLEVKQSTISGNTATLFGGGIRNDDIALVQNSTVSGNQSRDSGGGIENRGDLSLYSSTVFNNYALMYGGGIGNNGQFIPMNSIIVGNTANDTGNDIVNVVTVNSQGFNLLGGGDTAVSSGYTPSATDLDLVTLGRNINEVLDSTLADNGGKTMTHALLNGSPAVDAGDPAFNSATMPNDQRGAGFSRIKNGQVDIGAFELTPNHSPTLTNISKIGIEDTPLTFTELDFTNAFTDINGHTLTTIKVISLPITGTLKLNGNIITAGETISRTELANLTYEPADDWHGHASFYWNASDGDLFAVNNAVVNVTINPIADTPTVTNASTQPNIQTTSGLVITPNQLDGPETTHFKLTNITGGHLFYHDGSTPINNGDFITTAEGIAGLKFTPTGSGNGSFTVQAAIGADDSGLGGNTIDAIISVTTINHKPQLTTINKTGVEDAILPFTQDDFTAAFTDSDGDTLNQVKIITLPSNGVLQLNGTPINPGQTIAPTGLDNISFNPDENWFGTTEFIWDASDGKTFAITNAFAKLTITPTVDTPTVTHASTIEGQQTITGLVITPHASDGDSITHYKITNITNGTLYHSNGITIINEGDFITTQDGANHLKFTPNSAKNGYFHIQASATASDAGLGGEVITAMITVNAMNDPTITPTITDEDTQTTTGLVISPNEPTTTHIQITDITNGTLFKTDGITPIHEKDFITLAEGLAGLKFTPHNNIFGIGSFHIQNATAMDEVNLIGNEVTAMITINPIADTPSVTDATTKDGQSTTNGLVIQPNSADGREVTHFKITAITNGTLSTKSEKLIDNNDFITITDGKAGLIFTPSTTERGSFQVQASLQPNDNGLGGDLVTATITVVPLTSPLAITVNNTASISEGESITLTSQQLQAIGASPTKLTYTLNHLPLHGQLLRDNLPLDINSQFTQADIEAGLIQYQHDNSESQYDEFRFTLSTEDAQLNEMIFSFDIVPVDDAPTLLLNNNLKIEAGSYGVLSQTYLLAQDVDTSNKDLVFTLDTIPTSGTVHLNGIPLQLNSSFTQADINAHRVTYHHNGSELLEDTFTFTLSDNSTQLTGNIFTINITPINKAPITLDDVGLMYQNNIITLSVLANDSDPNGDTLSLVSVDQPKYGTATINQDGTILYVPDDGFIGTDKFQYTVSDNRGGETTARVLILVSRANNRLPVVTAIEPTQPATIVISPTHGLPPATIYIPKAVTTTPFMLSYTDLVTLPGDIPSGLHLVGQGFGLNAYQTTLLQESFIFSQPITLSLSFSNEDVVGLDKTTLQVRYWDDVSQQWLDDGITVINRDLESNKLVISITHLTDFAIFGEQIKRPLFLPIVIK